MSTVTVDPAFRAIPELIREHAAARPRQPALVQGDTCIDYGQLDALMDGVAASLQRDGVIAGDTIAICAHSTPRYAAVFLGALRAGVTVAPLAPSVTAEQFASMLQDSQARLLFADGAAADLLRDSGAATRCIALQPSLPGTALEQWLVAEGSTPAVVALQPQWPFNIIYSSGTTGTPKGIVQSHGMRWTHVMRGLSYGYGAGTVTLLSTPLYSNTTLVVFLPSLAYGGTVHLMARFDAAAYLALAERIRVTHTMLVPVQYRRIMALADFDRHDLRSFHMKFCTSAPFDAALKADVLALPHNTAVKGGEKVQEFLHDSLRETQKLKEEIVTALRNTIDFALIAENILNREYSLPTIMGPREALLINVTAMVKSIFHEFVKNPQ